MWELFYIMIFITYKERITRFPFLIRKVSFSAFLFQRSIFFVCFTFPLLFTSGWFTLASRWLYNIIFGNNFRRKAFSWWILYGQSLSTFRILFLHLDYWLKKPILPSMTLHPLGIESVWSFKISRWGKFGIFLYKVPIWEYTKYRY